MNPTINKTKGTITYSKVSACTETVTIERYAERLLTEIETNVTMLKKLPKEAFADLDTFVEDIIRNLSKVGA